MTEKVPAPPAPNQVQDVVSVAPAPAPAVQAPEPDLAVPVTLVENRLPVAVEDVAQNAAHGVTFPSF